MTSSSLGAGKQLIKTLIVPVLFSFLIIPFASFTAQADVPPSKDATNGSLKPTVDIVDEKGASIPVEVAGDKIEYLRDEQKIIAEGNVIVTYKDLTLTCDRVEVLSELKQAFAKGHVVLYRGKDLYRGDEVFYDFENQKGSFPDGHAVDIPWYAHGEQVEQVGPEKLEIYNGSFTSCDMDRPHYELVAKRITVYLGDKAIARNVIFRVLGKPVFWWPYYIIPLDNRQPPLEIIPGHSKRYGYYLLLAKGFSLNKNISGKWHADWRAKRGFAAGVDLRYEFPKYWGNGEIKLYGMKEDWDGPDPRSSSPYNPSNQLETKRGRFTVKHRSKLGERTSLLLNWHEASDEYVLADFFQREYRNEVTPESFVTVTHNANKYAVVSEFKKRSNRFDSTLEKLPEVRFNWKTAELADLGVYYQNQETISILNSTSSRSGAHTDETRVNTLHEINYPRKYFRIDIVPRINWEGTYWSESVSGDDKITRQVWGGGVDTSTRLYRIYDVKGSVWGIKADQIRHLIEPSVKYDAKRKVDRTNVSINQLDGIDSRAVTDHIVFGIENRIQTKRMLQGKIQRVDIVSMGSFLTYNMDQGRVHGSRWDTLNNNIQLRPYNWLTIEWTGIADVERDRWTSSNTDAVVRYRNLIMIIGHRYTIESSSLYSFDMNYWLNERWAVGMYWRNEFDRMRTEEFEFRLTRDLHDWLLDFGFNDRHDPELDKLDYGVFFELTLKAYTDRTLKSGNRRTIAQPRIGTTVSGAELGEDLEKIHRQGFQPEEDPLAAPIAV